MTEHPATTTPRQAVRRDAGEPVGHVGHDPGGAVPTTVFDGVLGPASGLRRPEGA